MELKKNYTVRYKICNIFIFKYHKKFEFLENSNQLDEKCALFLFHILFKCVDHWFAYLFFQGPDVSTNSKLTKDLCGKCRHLIGYISFLFNTEMSTKVVM